MLALEYSIVYAGASTYIVLGLGCAQLCDLQKLCCKLSLREEGQRQVCGLPVCPIQHQKQGHRDLGPACNCGDEPLPDQPAKEAELQQKAPAVFAISRMGEYIHQCCFTALLRDVQLTQEQMRTRS